MQHDRRDLQHGILTHLIGNGARHPRLDLEQAVYPKHKDRLPLELHMELPQADRAEAGGGLALVEVDGAAGPHAADDEIGFPGDADWLGAAEVGP